MTNATGFGIYFFASWVLAKQDVNLNISKLNDWFIALTDLTDDYNFSLLKRIKKIDLAKNTWNPLADMKNSSLLCHIVTFVMNIL